MSQSRWTVNDIPPQNGRSVLVTGTGGLGFHTSIALARAGAEVILAGRNHQKGEQAVKKILTIVPSSSVHFEQLDLASLASIAQFSRQMRANRSSLDVLINNAGIMATPTRQTTMDGFEVQLATNFLGPFALTAHLLPLLRAGKDPRVVMVSSLAARSGDINLKDLQSKNSYRAIPVYAQSKLADLIFALEFQRQSEANGWGVSGIAAHPGIANTDLIANGPGSSGLFGFLGKVGSFLFQSPEQGALPILFAATSREALGGGYYGPDGFGGTRGYPTKAPIPAKALDKDIAANLWDEAASLTGVSAGSR
jgi:NAD(P)-dependent dehydrogenase (short-subunit alcohol dehydrogenase family)